MEYGTGTWNRKSGPRKGDDVAERLESFAVAVLDMMPKLERTWASRHLARQLARCATGRGSNYEEARGAESHADFVHKVSVAAKELREAHYWLRLVRRSKHLSDRAGLDAVVAEADELIAILTASARTAKARAR